MVAERVWASARASRATIPRARREPQSYGQVGHEMRRALTRSVDDLPDMCVIKIVPCGNFVTYGIGIPMLQMRQPEKALARVPV